MKMNIADKVKAEFEAAICKAIEDWNLFFRARNLVGLFSMPFFR